MERLSGGTRLFDVIGFDYRLPDFDVAPKPFDVNDLVRLVAEAPLRARGASVG